MFDDEGWLKSGDIAMIIPGGRIKVFDRAKNMFKLAQGEYVAPEKLENIYVKSDLIMQIFVHGDFLSSFLVAIVVIDPEGTQKWMKENGK